MRVAELEGALLDYWVARAEGFTNTFEAFKSSHVEYSSNWAYGGLIVEREGIAIVPTGKEWTGCYTNGSASLDLDATATLQQDGSSPLVAAMRAFVASHFGEEVPDSAD